MDSYALFNTHAVDGDNENKYIEILNNNNYNKSNNSHTTSDNNSDNVFNINIKIYYWILLNIIL